MKKYCMKEVKLSTCVRTNRSCLVILSLIVIQTQFWYIQSSPKPLMGKSMKKITLLLVIIFTFLFSTTSWSEGELGSLGSSPPGKYFYDQYRVRKSGKYLYIWQLIDFAKPLENRVFSTSMYTQFDCSIFRFKSFKVQFY